MRMLLPPRLLALLACAPWAGLALADLPARPAPEAPRQLAVQPARGVEIRYDLLGAPQARTPVPARMAATVAGPQGTLRSSVLVNPGAPAGQRTTRLDTQWQAQMPNAFKAVVLGDAYGSGGGWSRPVRYGGVRLGRPLAPRAGTEHQPQAPVVDRPGPLPAGASDYELEAGRLRTGWATAQDDYGDGYAAAAWRHGLGHDLTLESRAEWTPERSAAGLEISQELGPLGSARATVAQSASPQQAGLRRGLGLATQLEGSTLSLAWDDYERGYTLLAAQPGETAPRARVQAGATLPLWGRAQAGLQYTRESRHDAATPTGALQLTAGIPLARRTRLSMNYSHQPADRERWKAGVTLSLPLAP